MYKARPPINNIPFKFGSSGYSPPDFNAVNFSFPARFSDLKAAIVGSNLQRDYLKHCETYVLGYNSNNVQILRHSCLYGGIRDLQVNLDVIANFFNLSGYIKSTLYGYIDLNESLRGWGEGTLDLQGVLKSWNREVVKNLPVYMKQGETSQLDLSKYVDIFQSSYTDLNKLIKGWSTGNIRDLVNTVKPWYSANTDLSEYLRPTTQQTSDLILDIFKIWQTKQYNINAMLHGWQEMQLQKIIQVLHTKDLPASIRATYLNNLGVWLYAIQPVDISANLMAWAAMNLPVYIEDGPYAGDLPKYIYGIDSVDLRARLLVRKAFEVAKDLNFRLTNLQERNLSIHLNTIQYTDLNIYLLSSRQLVDLQVKIYPKIVHIKHRINIDFLEHRDLAAVINFSCFSSMFRNLAFTIDVKQSKDLSMYIYGTDEANISNLRFSINTSDYMTQNTVVSQYLNIKSPTSYTTLKYKKKSTVCTINTISVLSANIGRSYLDLSLNIDGQYIHKDLGIIIRPYINRHYESPSVLQKFIILKLKNNQEDFRRYVELTFNSYVNTYYYFSGNRKVYRMYRDDHWVVQVEGSKLLPVGQGFEKTKVRRKYIFNLKNYTSIDEAIRDMVDRVTQLKSVDLSAYIVGVNDRLKNLPINIFARRVYKSNRILSALIKGGTTQYRTLSSRINAVLTTATYNLSSTIIAVSYKSTVGRADFNFIGTGDVMPPAEDADFIFKLEND